ncbi:unnamed protein product, partial [Prorocentrum cordatum]
AILAPKTPLPAAASVRCCRQKGSWQQAGVPMAARTASSLELGLPEEDGAESPVPRSLLKEFEAVSDYPGQPDAEPLVPRRRLRGLRALSGRGCSAVAAALAAVGLLAAAAAASPWRGAEPKGPRGAPAGSLVLQGKQEQHSQDGCGDAAAGDGCFEHVAWAREHGILQHPEWYPGLTPSSPASSFQRVLFRQGMGGCRRPCGDAAGPRHASARGRHESGAPGGSSAGPSSSKVDGHLRSSARAAGSSKKKALEASKQRRGSRPKPGPQETQAARRGPRPEEGDAAPERSAADAPAAAAESREQPERSGAEERRRATGAAGVQKDCHDAAPGEQCYGQIQWAMQTGVASNPEWYPGLNASSAFQDFQAFFSSEGRDGCREPCATGHWHGLPADSAAAKSRREKPVSSDVQAQIAAGLNGGPELFCWMLFKAHSYESGLVQLQLTNGYNIFACDAYALFTDFPTRRRAALRRRRRRRRQRGRQLPRLRLDREGRCRRSLLPRAAEAEPGQRSQEEAILGTELHRQHAAAWPAGGVLEGGHRAVCREGQVLQPARCGACHRRGWLHIHVHAGDRGGSLDGPLPAAQHHDRTRVRGHLARRLPPF